MDGVAIMLVTFGGDDDYALLGRKKKHGRRGGIPLWRVLPRWEKQWKNAAFEKTLEESGVVVDPSSVVFVASQCFVRFREV